MSKITREELLKRIHSGSICEVLENGVELKASWKKDCGQDISAIANHIENKGGWLVIGINNDGTLSGRNKEWVEKTEEKISNNIHTFLQPDFTVVNISGEIIEEEKCVLIIEITSPDDVVYWDSKAYKLIGTTSVEMKQHEILSLLLKLPGADYSKLEYQGSIDATLVMDFAQKLLASGTLEVKDLSGMNAQEVLSKLSILNRKASDILFGDFPVRIARYDENGDILDQKTRKGLYSILKDDFIESIQSWTRKQGTIVKESSLAAIEEEPYPIKALRDSLSNAVAHANYSKNKGDLLIEMYPDRLVISNNCFLDAEHFVNKWFSGESKSPNKLLMTTLRIPKITDELGSGKKRIFRYMVESGKREPIIEFRSYENFGRWIITLYNNQDNLNLLKLIRLLKQRFSKADKWRLAAALVLWRDKNLQVIEDMLDEHYKRILQDIVNDKESPVLLFQEKGSLILRRWAKVAIEVGQTSKAFTISEENNIKEFLNYYAYKLSSKGNISNSEIRDIIGLSNAPSEKTQLSRMLKTWKEEGVIEPVKRGEWKFVNKPSRHV